MGSHHWQTTCSYRWRHDLPKRWKCRRCCLCHDCRHIHHVGCAFLGRRNAGFDLQSQHQKSGCYQCHGCSPNRCYGRFLQGSRNGLPSAIWSLSRNYAGYSRRNNDHAGRVWNPKFGTGASTRHGPCLGLSHRSTNCQCHREQ